MGYLAKSFRYTMGCFTMFHPSKKDNSIVHTRPLLFIGVAIRLTVPGFELKEIGQHLYSFDEVKTINQIANIYSLNGQNKKAIGIYSQLFNYIQNRFTNILQSGSILPLIAYCYTRSLDVDKQYKDALEIAKVGMNACVQYGQYRSLSGILAIMAESSYFLGREEESKRLYFQAYYLALTLHQEGTLKAIRKEMKEYLGIVPKY